MNDKLTLQELTDLLAERHQMDPQDADAFVKTFWILVEEGLKYDNYVKIKGLGTFKLIETEARESIDVHSGERIEIQSHSRVTFTPDASLRDQINRPFAHFETVVLNEGTVFDTIDEKMDSDEEDEMESVSENDTEQVKSNENLTSLNRSEQSALEIPEEQPAVQENVEPAAPSDFILPEEELPASEPLAKSNFIASEIVGEVQPANEEAEVVLVPEEGVVSENLSEQGEEPSAGTEKMADAAEDTDSAVQEAAGVSGVQDAEQPVDEAVPSSLTSFTEEQTETPVGDDMESEKAETIHYESGAVEAGELPSGESSSQNDSASSQSAETADSASVDLTSVDAPAADSTSADSTATDSASVDSTAQSESVETDFSVDVEQVACPNPVQAEPASEHAAEEEQKTSLGVTIPSLDKESFLQSEEPVKKSRFPWCMVAAVLLVGVVIGGIVAWGLLSGRRYIPESMVTSFLKAEKELEEQKEILADSVALLERQQKMPEQSVQQTKETASKPVVTLPTVEPQQTAAPAKVAAPQKEQKAAGQASVQQPAVSQANAQTPKILSDKVRYKITGTIGTHTIRKGDSLVKLARRFYGNKKLWPYIVKHNRKSIKDPDNVPIGTTLQIPQLTPISN